MSKTTKTTKTAKPVSKEVAALRSLAAYKAHITRQEMAAKSAKGAAKSEAVALRKEIQSRLASFTRANAKVIARAQA
jgi:hypothetical protein